MIFKDLDKAVLGDWFDFFESRFDQSTGQIIYDPPEKGAVQFCVRSMTPFFEELRKGRKKVSKIVYNPVSKAMERLTFPEDTTFEQDAKESDDAWDYAITAAKDEEGKDVELTREMKLKLIKIPKFVRFFTRVFQVLNGEVLKKEEAEEKN